MTDLDSRFGMLCAEKRATRGLSADAAARWLGMARERLNAIEHGRADVTRDELVLMCLLYGIRVENWMGTDIWLRLR